MGDYAGGFPPSIQTCLAPHPGPGLIPSGVIIMRMNWSHVFYVHTYNCLDDIFIFCQSTNNMERCSLNFEAPDKCWIFYKLLPQKKKVPNLSPSPFFVDGEIFCHITTKNSYKKTTPADEKPSRKSSKIPYNVLPMLLNDHRKKETRWRKSQTLEDRYGYEIEFFYLRSKHGWCEQPE